MTGKLKTYSVKHRRVFIASCILLVIFIGIIDYLSGYEISFSIFYLLPIMLVAWHIGRFSAFLISVFSAVTWVTADLSSGHIYSHYTIPIWNSMMRLGFFLVVAHFLTTNKKLLEREEEMARTDSLTGAGNGRYFYELANIEMDRTERFNRPLTLAYIDIDNFKQINDTLGHSTGDMLLKSIAEAIRENLRSMDIIARLGGDEFAVLLPETGQEQSEAVIGKIRKYLLDTANKNNWPVTFSIGVVTCRRHPCNIDQFLKAADDLMYSVKKSGKNMTKYKDLDA